MHIQVIHDEQISLTLKEVQLLLALSEKPLDGGDISRACAGDSGMVAKMSNGTLYPALKRLERGSLIEKIEPTGISAGKGRSVYRLTKLGRTVLEWEITSLRRLVEIADERLKLKKAPKGTF